MQGQPSLPVVTEDDDAEGGMLYRYCSYFRIAGHVRRPLQHAISATSIRYCMVCMWYCILRSFLYGTIISTVHVDPPTKMLLKRNVMHYGSISM
jgi:hypothetical protein